MDSDVEGQMNDEERERTAELLDRLADVIARSGPLEAPNRDVGVGWDQRGARYAEKTRRPPDHRGTNDFAREMVGTAMHPGADIGREKIRGRSHLDRTQNRGECIVMTRMFFAACVCSGVLIGAVVGAEIVDRLVKNRIERVMK